MNSLPELVRIFSVELRKEVECRLVRFSRELACKVDGTWWDIPVPRPLRSQEGDNTWLWRKIVGQVQSNAAFESLAIQSSEDRIEGAIQFRIDAKSTLEAGQGAVYISYVAVAPRNRPWLCASPEFRGVGTVLLFAAVRSSYSLGLKGRVALDSLPSEKTRQFYERRGFVMTFENADGTIGYELPAAAAEDWLVSEGYLS